MQISLKKKKKKIHYFLKSNLNSKDNFIFRADFWAGFGEETSSQDDKVLTITAD